MRNCTPFIALPLSLGLAVAFSNINLEAQTAAAQAQTLLPVAQANRVPDNADLGPKLQLSGHVPAWANASREIANHAIDPSTPWRVSITLQRDPAVQAAFEKLLADQQTPGSPLYHHWLTSTEVGNLYGPTQHDVDAVVDWLTSQGLKVIDVAPSRMLIDVDGTLGTVSAAFHASFSYYRLGEVERRASRTEPVVPAALAPLFGAIGGMAEIITEPQVHKEKLENPELYLKHGVNDGISPNYTASSTVYYLAAGDFDTIYDINSVVTGGDTGATIGSLTNANCPVTTAQCIAIIGRSRVTTADITYYMNNYGANGETTYHLTQTAVPSGSGGSDPGITYDGNDDEATLDVERVVGTANGAQAVLVLSGSGSTDGADTATNYNVNTLMYPIMTLSFGLCEANSSSAQQTSRQTIFSQAASEGISTFVSAGDSAAAGCDTAFTTPPASQFRSPNYLCATGYVTCVGGTEFNDASAYATYWNTTNSTGGESAKSYIPEGAWNEPGTSGAYQVAGTGGGVSTYVTKPTFQAGTGVPTDGMRDTPDVAFTSANHDGYLGPFTASSGGSVGVYAFSGTSAAAPSMAAITALLNTKLGFKAGELNPLIYKLAATNASAFHDVTVSSSGVASCTTASPSMCNNSTAGSKSSLTGGLAGYAVTAGYDQSTGWGSLDVANFLTAAVATNLTVSSVHTGFFAIGSTGDVYTLTVTNAGATASSGTISVVDTLPTGFTATALSGTGWTCTLATITCTQSAALAANTSASAITLTVSVSTTEVAGTYNNTVTVSLASILSDTATDPTIVRAVTPTKLVYTTAPATPIGAGGNAGTVQVAIEDASGNIATNNSTDVISLAVTGPSSYSQTYTATAASGVASFNLSSVSLTVLGTYTYVASYTGLTSASTTEVVSAGTAASLTVTGLGTFTSPGVAGTATVTAYDAYGNVATGFTGAVTLTSTDSAATLPAAFTYTSTNAGTHAFSVTLNTAGTFSVTATSTSPSLTASETGIVVEDAVWVLNKSDSLARISDVGAQITTAGSTSGSSTAGGLAFDHTGNVWATNQDSSTAAVVEFNHLGTAVVSVASGTGGLASPGALAVDGSGQIWVLDVSSQAVTVLTNTGTAFSGSNGYQKSSLATPTAIAIDSAGSVWITSDGSSSKVTKIFGAAAPVVAPTVTGVTNVQQGAQP